jgi:cardiolipin synthase
MADATPAKQSVTAEVDGNRLTLLPEGPERLQALVALIDGAAERLRIL